MIKRMRPLRELVPEWRTSVPLPAGTVVYGIDTRTDGVYAVTSAGIFRLVPEATGGASEPLPAWLDGLFAHLERQMEPR